jgi:iron complex outermembrane receptor protein
VLLAAVAVNVIGFDAIPAMAQETVARVDSSEIIVTARKRQESVLKVPVIENVLTPEVLQQRQIVDIRGITQNVPGLQLGTGVLTIGTQIALRGVGTSSLDAGVEQSVALNIDGLQFTQGTTYDAGMFDMAQVEVLKGPQALFYGKNVVGGVIAIRTADPSDRAEVIGRASYEFEAHERRFEAIASGPITDTFGVRVAGYYAKDDGYFFNRASANPAPAAIAYGANTPRDRYNINENWFVRGTAVWKPIDDLSARFKINHGHQKLIGGSGQLGSCPDGTATPAAVQALNPGVQFINPNDTCKLDRNVYLVDLDPNVFVGIRNNGVPFMEKDFTFGSAELNYGVAPDVKVASETAFFDTTIDGMINGVNSGYSGPTLYADNHFTRHEITQEIRVESDFKDKPVNFLVGGYYQNGRIRNRIIVGGNPLERIALPALGNPTMATLLATNQGVNDVSVETFSAFGQLRWKPVTTLEIAVGGRYTDERRHFTGTRLAAPGNASYSPVTVPNPTLHPKKFSPELTVTYTPTDDLTVFGSLKRGYKSGNFIMTTAASNGTKNDFGDERAQGGEIGFKARTADRSFNVDAAFYYYDYKGLQVGVNIPAQNGVPVIQTVNAGSARSYGIDYNFSYRPPSIEGLLLHLSGEWNHARFTDFQGAQCWGGQTVADGCNMFLNPNTHLFQGQDLTGARLPKAADWTFNGGFDYDMPVGDAMHIALGANGQYSSKFTQNLGTRADFFQPAFFKLNANLALKGKDDAWEVALIGNNLTNKYTAGNCTSFGAQTGQTLLAPTTGGTTRNAAGVDELACIADPGRQVFLRLTLRPLGF